MGRPRSPNLVAALFLTVAVLATVAAAFYAFHATTSLSEAPPTVATVSHHTELDEPNFHEATDDFSPYRPDAGWEILEPVAVLDADEAMPATPAPAPTPAGSNRSGPTGTLVVITNFSRAEVTVNGDPYPGYFPDGENSGMRLPARTEHEILVNFDGRHKIYRITLNPGERRLLMVELTGMRAGDAPAPRPQQRRPDRRADNEPASSDEDTDGRGEVTVYSRPQGSIYVGGLGMGEDTTFLHLEVRHDTEDTPGTVQVDEGRHEITVRYEDGQMSEPKVVRVREGSRIKLFFRQDEE